MKKLVENEMKLKKWIKENPNYDLVESDLPWVVVMKKRKERDPRFGDGYRGLWTKVLEVELVNYKNTYGVRDYRMETEWNIFNSHMTFDNLIKLIESDFGVDSHEKMIYHDMVSFERFDKGSPFWLVKYKNGETKRFLLGTK
jgi:hypothetical protein